jgi:glycosyltransferase involved in cell wall biosynthesis
MSSGIKWHMITGEYPPQTGGVSDYSRLVARALAACGDTVKVYAPGHRASDPDDEGVTIHRLPGHFGPRALAELSRSLGDRAGDRLLIQYVPHAFGFKAMNLPLCLWLYAHTRKNGGATVIFHEVRLGFQRGDPMRHWLLDAVTSVMARLVARSAAQIFVVTPVWEPRLRRYVPEGQAVIWLPVPSNIEVAGDRAQIAAARRLYVSKCGPVIGHFGTYPSAIAGILRTIIPRILADNPSSTMVLTGGHGDTFRESLVHKNPELASRLVATGALPANELSLAIGACDLMIQPYPDGVTTRRGSMMAVLAHGGAAVTTQGLLTEPLWKQSGAVALAPVGDSKAFASLVSELIADEGRRREYETAAKALYDDRFDLRHTIRALRASACA